MEQENSADPVLGDVALCHLSLCGTDVWRAQHNSARKRRKPN